MPDASHGKRLFDGLLDYPLSTTDGTTRDYVFYFAENSGRTPVSGRLLHDHQQEGAERHGRGLPAAFPPPAFASWSSFARRVIGFPHGQPTSNGHHNQTGPWRGFHVPHAQDATGVGALYSPGTGGALSRPATITGLHPAHHSAASLHRATTSTNARLRLGSHPRGFKQFARPAFPSPVATGWIGGHFGFPPSFAPRDHSRRTPGRGRTS